MSSVYSPHPQEVLLVQFSLYLHKRGPKPLSCIFDCANKYLRVEILLLLLRGTLLILTKLSNYKYLGGGLRGGVL